MDIELRGGGRLGFVGDVEKGVHDSVCLVKRPAQAFSQARDRHIEMSSPANRSLEAF